MSTPAASSPTPGAPTPDGPTPGVPAPGAPTPGVPAPDGSPHGWGGRLPLLDPADLDPDQRRYYDALMAGSVPWAAESGFAAETDDGRLMGPFNGFLHSPALAAGFGRWIGAETAHTRLPTALREVVILTVGVAWEAAYEIYAHVAVARSVGVDEAVIDGIRQGATTDAFDAEQAVVHDFTRALVVTHRVDEATYRRAVDTLGQGVVVDMTHLVGLYLATSALLNAFEVPAPPVPDPGTRALGASWGA